jgi:citrate synthase
LIGHHPNVDFALGVISIALKLPPGSGLGMFLIGRSVGWIAHAMEQYATGALIRPRARYVGVLPTAVQ